MDGPKGPISLAGPERSLREWALPVLCYTYTLCYTYNGRLGHLGRRVVEQPVIERKTYRSQLLVFIFSQNNYFKNCAFALV